MRIEIASEAATCTLAAALAAALRQGDCVLLSGPYGAGKSFLARAAIRACLQDPAHDIPSPSFSLVQTYETPRGKLHHFDLWRLGGTGEAVEIGFWEALSDITLVEWPERLGNQIIAGALSITITPGEGENRVISLSGWPEEKLRTLFAMP